MNKFYASIPYSLVVNRDTGDAVLLYGVDIADFYAWYVNEATGLSDAVMATMTGIGMGDNYSMKGGSDMRAIFFNIEDMENAELDSGVISNFQEYIIPRP